VRATEDSKPRDRAIVVLLLYTALRLPELVTCSGVCLVRFI
jgi:hypothetical protein